MPHRNAPLTPAGRLRLIQRCQHRLVAHVAAEAGVSPGADTLDRVLAITPAHVLLAWTTTTNDKPGPDIIAAYDRATGTLLDTLQPEIPVPTSAGTGHTNTDGTVTATAGIILTGDTLTDVPHLSINTVQNDQVYGTIQGDPVVITAGRIAATTPATLTPTAATNDHLLVISQRQLYALPRTP